MNLVTSPRARPSLRLYTMRPAPPCCAASTHSSMPCTRYGRHVQMSEPKTSEPLHSSCTRTARGLLGSGIESGSPTMYAVQPPMGGRKTERSVRVTSSGNMPPVCSKSMRRSVASSSLKRRAMPGRYQTGSIAHLITETTQPSCRMVPSTLSRPAATACSISIGLRLARETAMVGCTWRPRRCASLAGPWGAACVARCPHGSRATILSGSDHEGKGPILMPISVEDRSSASAAAICPRATPTAR
mmetsp:Transcript_19902/g.50343  ORF Transcript_19902/g.50343 Transcript_19902/m.50343 type:complete len:244 (+) Transcript_19902:759-1490(+)